MSEWLIITIILLVVYSFILYIVIKNAIDNSKAIRRIETLLEQLVKENKRP